MEVLHFSSSSSPLSLFLTSLLFLSVYKLVTYQRRQRKGSSNTPPGPWRLPIIGNIHYLVGKEPPHRMLRRLAGRYGPLIGLRLGEIDMVVASSPEAAAEIMKTHDINFSFRLEMLLSEIMFNGGRDILFASYGEYWRQLRKICTVELLSAHRVRSFSRLRGEEVDGLIARVAAASAAGCVVNLKEELFALCNDILCKAAFGRRCAEQQEFIPIIAQVHQTMSGLSVVDLFPSLHLLGTLTGMRRKLEDMHRKADRLLDDIICDHEEKAAVKISRESSSEEDLVDVLLRLKNEDRELGFMLTPDSIKAVILDMFIAGTEVPSTLLNWAMAELMRNPSVMSKAQAEVRRVVPQGTKIVEEHIQELKYLPLVVKETLRLHIPSPLLAPRLCKDTCKVLGYTVPAGARVFVNAWAICRDPRYWDDPETFRPERFEEEENGLDFKGINFKYTPFGSGRRICPGVAFGLAGVELSLAQLLYNFDWELPGGMRPEELDMMEAGGLNAYKKVPLCVLAKSTRFTVHST